MFKRTRSTRKDTERFVIREMEIKITMRLCFILTVITGVYRNVEKLEPSYFASGDVNGAVTLKS